MFVYPSDDGVWLLSAPFIQKRATKYGLVEVAHKPIALAAHGFFSRSQCLNEGFALVSYVPRTSSIGAADLPSLMS